MLWHPLSQQTELLDKREDQELRSQKIKGIMDSMHKTQQLKIVVDRTECDTFIWALCGLALVPSTILLFSLKIWQIEDESNSLNRGNPRQVGGPIYFLLASVDPGSNLRTFPLSFRTLNNNSCDK
jgi:hypothetical protein